MKLLTNEDLAKLRAQDPFDPSGPLESCRSAS